MTAPDRTTRDLPADQAQALPPGGDHYRAYVGPPGQWDFMGATQFRLLTALGLRETDRLLDVGCGSLRAGRLLIPYLAAGGYHGIEPNSWLLEDAIAREVGAWQIDRKRPRFSDSADFDAGSFGVDFDFIVAQSVFSHAGPELVSRALGRFRAALKPEGLILATFIHSDLAPEIGAELPGWTYPECTSYAPQRILELIAAADLVGRALPWFHPRQTWYAIGKSPAALPAPADDPHLSGAVLRSQAFRASTTRIR